MMKLHIGCGSVYLDGWVNIDLQGQRTHLAANRPDLVEIYKTSDDDYYGRHKEKTLESLSKGPLYQQYVCDKYGSFMNIPVPAWSASEVLARHCFEHLSLTEAHQALDQVESVLTENGILRLDVPDHEATLQEFKRTSNEFYIRHLLGPRSNDYGFHMMSYTRGRLRKLVEEHGFIFVEEEPNIHLYPAFCLKFVKPGPRSPREYVELPEMPANWSFLDVGPGGYPHPRATHYLDRNPDNLRKLSEENPGKKILYMNLDRDLGIPSKSFDFVWCSHVLEHVDDPLKVVSELSRIGKQGVVIVPSAIKESLFNFEENEHKWLILPSPQDGGAPVFVRHNSSYISALKDSNVQRTSCYLYRTGPNRIHGEQRFLRTWFYERERNLDVVHFWKDEIKIQVIG